LGVVILVLVALTYVRRVTVVWDSRPGAWATVDYVEINSGILVVVKNWMLTWQKGVYFGTSSYRISPRRLLIGEYWAGSIGVGRSWYVVIPATLPVGLSAALIGLSFWRRHPKGHCPKCGYDLSGITDQCPECGRAVKEAQP